MAEVGNDAYVDMSLDDVIKQMKAKKARQEAEQGLPTETGNSVFFRQPNAAMGQNQMNRPFRPYGNRPAIGYGRQTNQSNYARFAKKKVQQAHKTLDLRRRLIHLRATKEGLDLRWKIVANMVLEMRNRARANPRVQPYPTPGGRPSYLRDIPSMPAMSNTQGYRSSMSQIERLVGRLPPWMKNPNYFTEQQQRLAQQQQSPMMPRHDNGGGPFARPRAYYPVRHQQPPPSVIPMCYHKPHPVPVMQHHHQSVSSCAPTCGSHTSHNTSIEIDPLMPPLAPQPPLPNCVPRFGAQMQRNPPFHHAPARELMLPDDNDDAIEFTVINENCATEENQRTVKMTLNQRFQGVN